METSSEITSAPAHCRPRTPIADALDQCLDDVLLSGGAVEESVERWPELRDELHALMRVAVMLAATADRWGAVATDSDAAGLVRRARSDRPLPCGRAERQRCRPSRYRR